MTALNTLETLDGSFFASENILKMFPVSFERPSSYDRVLSEENLVDWFRSVTSDSADTDKNSRYSYVITDTLSSNFGKTDTVHYLEFIIGGYYVKMTDQGFRGYGNSDIYAVIEEVSSTDFRHLAYGDSITNGTFSAIKFIYVEHGALPENTNTSMYRLHILTKTDEGFTIPTESKRSTYAVDGGEIS